MEMVQHYPAVKRPANPICSVCIANYNGVALLADCLDSVIAQQGNFSVEIIVHDDASTDDSLTLLRERYPQIEVLASAKNIGFCISNNRMAAHARGEYILLLNNDAALDPGALATLLQAAREQKPAGILTLPQYDWSSNALVDRGCLLDPFYNPVPNINAERRDVAMVIGACLWIPRNLWDELGGFPAWFESVAEDLYLCCRARLAGYPVQVTVASYYRHQQGLSFGGNRAGEAGLQTTYRRRRLSERNKTFVLGICSPSALVWLLMPMHLLALSVEGITLSLLRWDLRLWREVYANVWISLWRQRRLLHEARARVRASRRVSTNHYLRSFTALPRKLVMLLRYGLPKVR
ncbi:glycosyltransferase family 2 protein [Rhodanobacter glycinis]|uniref:Glycosyltransferase family 2 protein n=1 Tax=Rhodanobacter glycinis TaxID=582702 RepID=A0A5B9DWQ6_9GAMM|nr:glycosyltransferase family 2 protein [Rhodanobacter glycinis]QEE23828.1 glycosyltransferase family 2 protein [Rhodanobacter glycinis]